MATDVKPIRSEADYDAAIEEVATLWGTASGTPEGDRLDVLATLIDAYEAAHHPMDAPLPTTLKVGIASYEDVKARTMAVARGEHHIAPDEPKVWFTSAESFAKVLSVAFRAEARRQSAAVAASTHAGDDQAFIEAISDRDDER